MKYLLDTNVLIAMFRKQHGIREKILQTGIDNCFISEATLAELKVGAYKTNDPRQWREVKETSEAFGIIPITTTDFDLYARNRALLSGPSETTAKGQFTYPCAATCSINLSK